MKLKILAAIAFLPCFVFTGKSVQAQNLDLFCYYISPSGQTIDLGEVCGITTAKVTPVISTPIPTTAQPTASRPTQQSRRANAMNLTGTWISKLTSRGQLIMGLEARFTRL